MIITNSLNVLRDIVAKTIRTYRDYEYIDFVSRSKSAKGTIRWSEYIADYLLKSPDFTTYITDSLKKENYGN